MLVNDKPWYFRFQSKKVNYDSNVTMFADKSLEMTKF